MANNPFIRALQMELEEKGYFMERLVNEYDYKIAFNYNLINRFIAYTDVEDTTIKGYSTYIRQFMKQGWNMYLHKDREAFKEVIEQVAEDSGRAAVVIEKDY